VLAHLPRTTMVIHDHKATHPILGLMNDRLILLRKAKDYKVS